VLETAQVFWALDKRLAQVNHFPSINWEVSTSNYYNQLDIFFKEEHDK
jgi:vacuolar-type H+-ATPase catalytic subunit A/Vma1